MTFADRLRAVPCLIEQNGGAGRPITVTPLAVIHIPLTHPSHVARGVGGGVSVSHAGIDK